MEMTVPDAVLAVAHPQAALVVTPNPLTLEGQRVLDAVAAELIPGETLEVFLARHGVVVGEQWAAEIGGCRIPEAMWRHTKPLHGHLIAARKVPQKDALRLVAIAALSYFTLGAGGLAAGGAGTSAGLFAAGGAIGGGWLAAAGVFLAGSLVINKMLAPKQAGGRQESQASPTYGLSAGRNRPRPYEAMGLVLGEPYGVPDLAAQPYTYFASGEQYLWQMFHLGLNCADVTNLRIGQTPLSSYQGVTVLRNGLASGNSAFPALGTSVDTTAGATLVGAGDWVVRTTSPGTIRVGLDIVSSLFYVNNDGVVIRERVDIEVEYRAVGSGTWLPFTDAVPEVPAVTEQAYWPPIPDDSGGERIPYTHVITPAVPGVPAGTVRLFNASQKPVRLTVEGAFNSDQYEIRMRKVDADITSTSASNTVEWLQLKSYQADTATYDGQARLAIQIQASGQLNGALDELNGQLRAQPMDYWNGSAWVTATDRASGLCNPGAIFLLLARGRFDSNGRRLFGLGYTDDQIDIEGLKRFMVHCAAKGFEFDYYVQESMSTEELMDAVAYAGMGEMGWPDGKLGVTFYSRDDPIKGIINMGTIKARSFEVSYETMPTADELEVRYFDRDRGNDWKPIRVKMPWVDVPRVTAPLQLVGVTKEAHAATLARFVKAQDVYQRKSVSMEMDLEYMTYRKGSVVALSHDLTQWGYSGRLLACQDVAGVITLTLDDIAPGENPLGGSSSRFIGLRLPGEQQMRVFPVQAFSGDARTVTLDAEWPVGVPLPGASAGNPARDTVWIYDFKAVPGQRMFVTSIEPGYNGARMGLAPISDEFWDMVETGAYQPPPNNSLLRVAPAVTAVGVFEQLARQGNTFYTDLTLTFEVVGNFSRAELWGATGEGEASPPQTLLASSSSQSLNWRGGLDERWHLELRVYGDIRAGEPYRLFYDVVGLREPPPPFDFFTVLAQPDGTRQFNFGYSTTPAPVDWLGAEIRYLVGTHADPDWDSMLPLQEDRTHYTASPIEVNQLLSGAHTFACRSLDTSGNPSTPRYYQLTLPPRRLGNVVQEIDDRAEGWLGEIVDGEINGATGGIEAIDTSTWSSLTTWSDWTRWSMSPESPIVYTSPVRDLTAVLTFLIDVSSAVEGTPDIEIRSSETSDDPMADPGLWTAWGPADVKVVARYFQIRITVTATGGSPVPKIDQLAYVVSAPVLNEYVNDCDISTLAGSYRIGTGDVRVPLANTYSTLLELQVVIQDASAGTWSWQVIDKTLTYGPRVQFKLNGVLADPDLVDFIVKGF